MGISEGTWRCSEEVTASPALQIFVSVSIQCSKIAISLFWRYLLNLFRMDNRALEKGYCKLFICVSPGERAETEFVKLQTHPGLRAASSPSVPATTSFVCSWLWIFIHMDIYTSYRSIQWALNGARLPCSDTLPWFPLQQKTSIEVHLVPFNPCW